MTRLVCLSLALAAIAACRDATFPAAPRAFAVDRSTVTGAAAAALNSEGFVDLSPQRAWSRTELTEMGAKALADAYVRDFVPTLPAWFERHRGADIDFTSLQACGRAFYAATPYEEPDVSMPVAVVNAIASRWLFSYCDRPNVPAVSVAVSAAATHVRLAAGRIAAGTLRGNDFFAAGIPLGTTAPMLPERAVEKLARESGARVASVPRLILAGRTAAPQAARWLFDLEVPVKSVANGESRSQRRYFVGREVHSWQVTTARNRYEHGDPDDVITLPDGRRFIVKRSAVMSAHLEVVTFEGGAK